MYVYYLENFFFSQRNTFHFRGAMLMIWRRERPSLPLPVKLRKSPSLSLGIFFLVFLSFLIFMYQDQHLVWTAAAGVCPTLVVFAS